MKKFKDFIKKNSVITDYSEPVHGSHAKGKMITDYSEPVHGSHAKGKIAKVFAIPTHGSHSIKESLNTSWYDKEDNSHLSNSDTHDNNSLSAIRDKLKKHHDFSNPDVLSEKERSHVEDYTDDSSKLNSALVRSARDNSEIPSKYHRQIDHLDSALDRNRLPTSLHVYSGMGGGRVKSVKSAAGGKLSIPAYTSTSTSKTMATHFAPYTQEEGENGQREFHRHVLHVELPQGHPGLFIGNDSTAGNEHEFLLPRDTKLHIHPEPTKVVAHNESSPGVPYVTHVWHAHPVKE
jgi:hypothetical protein